MSESEAETAERRIVLFYKANIVFLSLLFKY